jgi:hypothetical protein
LRVCEPERCNSTPYTSDRVGTSIDQSHSTIDKCSGTQAGIVVEAQGLQRIGELDGQRSAFASNVPNSQRIVDRAREQNVFSNRVELGNGDLANVANEVGCDGLVRLAVVLIQILGYSVDLQLMCCSRPKHVNGLIAAGGGGGGGGEGDATYLDMTILESSNDHIVVEWIEREIANATSSFDQSNTIRQATWLVQWEHTQRATSTLPRHGKVPRFGACIAGSIGGLQMQMHK